MAGLPPLNGFGKLWRAAQLVEDCAGDLLFTNLDQPAFDTLACELTDAFIQRNDGVDDASMKAAKTTVGE